MKNKKQVTTTATHDRSPPSFVSCHHDYCWTLHSRSGSRGKPRPLPHPLLGWQNMTNEYAFCISGIWNRHSPTAGRKHMVLSSAHDTLVHMIYCTTFHPQSIAYGGYLYKRNIQRLLIPTYCNLHCSKDYMLSLLSPDYKFGKKYLLPHQLWGWQSKTNGCSDCTWHIYNHQLPTSCRKYMFSLFSSGFCSLQEEQRETQGTQSILK